MLSCFVTALAQLTEVGHHDAYVMPGAPQRSRKGAGHIGQTIARLLGGYRAQK